MSDKPISSYAKHQKHQEIDATSSYGSKKEQLIFFQTQSEDKSLTNEYFQKDATRSRSDFSKRLRSVPSKKLTSAGFAVCFFPEHGAMEVLEESPQEVVEETVRKKTVGKLDIVRKPNILKFNKRKDKKNKSSYRSTQEFVNRKFPRIRWRNRITYLIALASFTLSMNNIYHFPLQLYRYGGVFLIPYTFSTFVIGYPLLVMQTSFGQYAQRSLFKSWSCAPLCVGVGISMFALNVLTSTYYNLFGAYSLVYITYTFHKTLPWTYCFNTIENNDTCVPRFCNPNANFTSPSKQFFYNHILGTFNYHSPSNLTLADLKWWLVVAVLIAWIIIYLCTTKTTISIGFITSYLLIFAYFVMVTLFVVIIQMKNYWKGPKMALEKNHSIFSTEIWIVATVQVLYSLGICHGVPIVYSSYCHFRNFFHVDSFLLCLFNYFNSLVLFILLFGFIGIVNCEIGGFPWDIMENSFGIVYIMYSEVFSIVPGGHVWSLPFFAMIFVLVLCRQIALVETVMNVFYDNFTQFRQFRLYINVLICLLFFLFNLFFCDSNSFFTVSLMENVVVYNSILPISFLFVFGLIIIYGIDNYVKNLQEMINFKKNNLLFSLFHYFVVIYLAILTIISLGTFKTGQINGKPFSEPHSILAKVLVGVILAPCILWVVIWIGFSWYIGDWKNVAKPIEPWRRHEEMIRNKRNQFGDNYNSGFLSKWVLKK